VHPKTPPRTPSYPLDPSPYASAVGLRSYLWHSSDMRKIGFPGCEQHCEAAPVRPTRAASAFRCGMDRAATSCNLRSTSGLNSPVKVIWTMPGSPATAAGPGRRPGRNASCRSGERLRLSSRTPTTAPGLASRYRPLDVPRLAGALPVRAIRRANVTCYRTGLRPATGRHQQSPGTRSRVGSRSRLPTGSLRRRLFAIPLG
jgi:hypothetical protein